MPANQTHGVPHAKPCVQPVASPSMYIKSYANTAGEEAHRFLLAKKICKSYSIGGELRRVLDDVDFQAYAGEMVFLCGPSGSGKSTLLSIMGCLLECDSGEVWISNRRVDQYR